MEFAEEQRLQPLNQFIYSVLDLRILLAQELEKTKPFMASTTAIKPQCTQLQQLVARTLLQNVCKMLTNFLVVIVADVESSQRSFASLRGLLLTEHAVDGFHQKWMKRFDFVGSLPLYRSSYFGRPQKSCQTLRYALEESHNIENQLAKTPSVVE